MASEFDHLFDPHNEAALLHLALTDFPAYLELGIEPRDYFSGYNERLAKVIDLANEELGQSDVQATRVAHFGRERGLLSTEEGAYVVTELLDPPLGVVPDAEKLKRQSRARDVREALLRAVRELQLGKPEQGYTIALEALQEAHSRHDAATDVRSARRLVEDWQSEALRLASTGGISVGLPLLKRAVGPLFPGAVLVVGAATGNGKSSLVGELLLAAADDRTKCGLVSMEDSNFVTVTRWLSGFSGISARTLHRGNADELERVAMGRPGAMLSEYEGRISCRSASAARSRT